MAFSDYETADVLRGLRNPSLIKHALWRQVRDVGARVNDRWYRRSTPDGFDVAEEDWDVLIILDGCRYDVFAERNRLEGTLEPRTSPASESWGFLQANFAGRQFHDTVYVTANPHWYKLDDGTFHHVVDLLSEAWDEELQTVLPGSVVEHALAAHERFPRKRLVVHFMQPHFPFIGERGLELEQKGLTLHLNTETGPGEMNIWAAAKRGNVSLEEVRAAYVENLDVVMPHVETLLDALPGKTVVTADHGNLIGDRLFPIPVRGFGHPPGLRAPELVTVPWLTVPGERIAVESERPTDQAHDTSQVDERLRDLGYK